MSKVVQDFFPSRVGSEVDVVINGRLAFCFVEFRYLYIDLVFRKCLHGPQKAFLQFLT